MRLRVLFTLVVAAFSTSVGVIAAGPSVASASPKSCYSTCPPRRRCRRPAATIVYGSEQTEVFSVKVKPRIPASRGFRRGPWTSRPGGPPCARSPSPAGRGAARRAPSRTQGEPPSVPDHRPIQRRQGLLEGVDEFRDHPGHLPAAAAAAAPQAPPLALVVLGDHQRGQSLDGQLPRRQRGCWPSNASEALCGTSRGVARVRGDWPCAGLSLDDPLRAEEVPTHASPGERVAHAVDQGVSRRPAQRRSALSRFA